MSIRADKRLAAIGDCVEGRCVADIGCDHGKLACGLVAEGRAERAIATDISAACLVKARELASVTGVADRVETRVGDGLAVIGDGEADCVVIAGMGGDLIANIMLSAAREGKKFSRFVLSPNTHAERVREAVCAVGQRIEKDFCVECAGKRYAVIATAAGEERLDGLQTLFGKFFRTDAEFARYADRELASLEAALGENPAATALAERKLALERARKECMA